MLRVDQAECVVFEDAVAGVQAALAAGMICVGIGSEDILTKAHIVVTGLNKMSLEKLEKIEKISGHGH
jgi:beta-phosphoglucomutase